MKMPSPQEILTELKKIKYPGFTRDIVSFGMITDIEVGYKGVTVHLKPPVARPEVISEIVSEIEKAVAVMSGVAGVKVEIEQPAAAPQAATAGAGSARKSIPGVAHVIAVASGK